MVFEGNPLLQRDINDYFSGSVPLYQLQRYLIAEKDDLKMQALAQQIADEFKRRLLQGVR